ncbi:MAG: bifunctional 2-methylcitrate synthase/citrate synthase [Planctomycetota bacterium]|nr:bifunctional 2-methylcitrate synthase/citrate synthase [Planctomycetota bacterium]MDA1177988.1 bifunctional 2-methylcitrate synthase/citrate synthase [Planctomycetota bacterium]
MTDANKDLIIRKGLEGVVYDTTDISQVIPDRQSLYYRGYPVHQLAERRSFEEVAFLLLNGELPQEKSLHAFQQEERNQRDLCEPLISVMRQFPRTAHPMDVVRTAVSFLGTQPEFSGTETSDSALCKGKLLLAKIPTIIATHYRLRRNEPIPTPRSDLSIAENFFFMCFGDIPRPEIVKAFDGSLTLYAEHGFNASTFAARVIVSTLSDLCSAVTGAIGSLKGTLHGGANEAVMIMLQEIGTEERAKPWLDNALSSKSKVMGFGHRLYRSGDSRVPTMSKYRDQVADLCDGHNWVRISHILEREMLAAKNIYPNLDFPAGPMYYMMGIDIDMFTPIFVMARIVGWTAHVAEQLGSNRLVRPLSSYIGPPPRDVP